MPAQHCIIFWGGSLCMISLPLRFRCGKPLAMVLFISMLIIWQPRGSAATAQTQPLDSAAFQNGWPVQDSGWHSVVGLYKNGELEALAKLLTGLAAEADSSLRLLALRNLAVVFDGNVNKAPDSIRLLDKGLYQCGLQTSDLDKQPLARLKGDRVFDE
jgi:hypothetical protein